MSGAVIFFIVFILGNTAMVNTEASMPLLRLEPEQPLYIVGESLSLRCFSTMQRITGYRFFKDASLIVNSTSNRLTISSVSTTDAGNYFCTYYIGAADRIPESFPINLNVIDRPLAPTLSVEPERSVFVVNQSVVLGCRLPGAPSATAVYLYQNRNIVNEADNFGVLSLTHTEKKNTGSYTCQYQIVISGRTVDSYPSNQVNLEVIDMPPIPVLRYAINVQNQSGLVEIVCEIPNPSSLIHGYRLYRNGGEVRTSKQANQFRINYNLEFDGCYFCRSFVEILGEEVLSPKSAEVFLTLEEKNRRSCQEQNSPSDYGLSVQGVKLYGSVLIGKLVVLISILIYFGIYLLVVRLRSQKSETEEQSFHRR